jgi:hypothetical protein
MCRQYVYPLECDSFALEFQWAPYEAVQLFLTHRSFEDVVAWYQEHLPDVEHAHAQNAKFECHFLDDSSQKEMSILIVDGRVLEARDSLLAYIGSRVLGEKVSRSSPATVGGLFRHKNGDDRRKEYREERTKTENQRLRKKTFETVVRLEAATALAQKNYVRFVSLLEPYADLWDDGLRRKYDLVQKKRKKA